MSQYLRQVTTGHIFAWAPELASRDDMEPFEMSAQKDEQTKAAVTNTAPPAPTKLTTGMVRKT